MKRLQTIFAVSVTALLLSACQMKLPFNNASEKLRKVATEYKMAADEEIVLGEFEDKAYKVLVENISETTIHCLFVDKKTNKSRQTIYLKKSNNITLRAAGFEKLIIQNPSNSPITIKMGFEKPLEGFRHQSRKKYKEQGGV